MSHAILAPSLGTDRSGFSGSAVRTCVPCSRRSPSSPREKLETLTALAGQLAYSDNEAARGYLDGKLTREQAIAWLVEVGLVPPPKAVQRLQFFDGLRSYGVNYNVGKDLVKGYVERAGDDKAKRWTAFEKVLASPRLPGDLKQAEGGP